MMQQWHLLYKTKSLSEASIIQGMLEENDIPVQILNKQDSSYLIFGDIELYVPITLKDIAKNLLNKALLN
ncbi:MAG: putative signal transducing protein [Chitinophagaceae bacterium]